jgi:RNA polymerase sigma-70 factor (ECF subfamily)
MQSDDLPYLPRASSSSNCMPVASGDLSASTSHSLLHRVRLRDAEAWQRFAALYTPLVYGWARRGGLQESDAADVVQDVFRSVFAKIGDFQNDGQRSHFRGWLWAITRNRVRLFYRQRAPQAQTAGGSDAAHQLAQVPDVWQREDDPSTPDDQRAFLRRALDSVKGDFAPETWRAFWRVAIDGRAAGEVAAELKLSASAVRQAKYRVLCRLREELKGLGPDLGLR